MSYDPDGFMSRNYPGQPYTVALIDGNRVPAAEGFKSPSVAAMQADYAAALAAGAYADWLGFAKDALHLSLVQRMAVQFNDNVRVTNLIQYCILVGLMERAPSVSFIAGMWGQLFERAQQANVNRTQAETDEWNALATRRKVAHLMTLPAVNA